MGTTRALFEEKGKPLARRLVILWSLSIVELYYLIHVDDGSFSKDPK